jgi:hypothetical protein
MAGDPEIEEDENERVPISLRPPPARNLLAISERMLSPLDAIGRGAQMRSMMRMTCVAVHSPSPRAVGMPRSFKPAR